MVCLGNICRSPLAEGILQSKVDATQIQVDSAGTAGYHTGRKPDSRSIQVVLNHGIDISQQRCRQVSLSDFANFDYIFAMDNANYEDLMDLAKNTQSKAKIQLISEILYPNQNVEIPDPYYGNAEDFETVYQLLEPICEAIAQQLTQSNNLK